MSQIRDCQLVAQLQEGDLEALGVLYDRHRQMVFRTALAITGDPEVAADLLQDVFLRIHRFSHHIDPERPLEPWLYRVTANLAYSWMKRQSRLLGYLREMADWLARDRKLTPHESAVREEEWPRVQQGIASLPLAQRVVVVLYYVNDLSLKEIAEILDIPIGTVKSRLYYGRRSLKRQLGLHRELVPEVSYEFP